MFTIGPLYFLLTRLHIVFQLSLSNAPWFFFSLGHCNPPNRQKERQWADGSRKLRWSTSCRCCQRFHWKVLNRSESAIQSKLKDWLVLVSNSWDICRMCLWLCVRANSRWFSGRRARSHTGLRGPARRTCSQEAKDWRVSRISLFLNRIVFTFKCLIFNLKSLLRNF